MKKGIKVILLLVLLVGIFSIVKYVKKVKTNSSGGIILKLDTDGLGQVSYYVDKKNKIDFNDKHPKQSVSTTFEDTTTITIDAKADKGWKFIKWTKDDKDYSKKSKLKIKVSNKTELIAVFEPK